MTGAVAAGPRRPAWAVAGILALVAVLVHANALANGFVLDDRAIVLGHPLVLAPARAWRAVLEPYWPAALGGGQYRPLGVLSFALDRAIAGEAAAWYHAVNVAWHAGVVVLVYRLALEWVAPLGAAVAGLAFALHPVHVEAVVPVVGRLELLAAAGVLATLLLHRRGHRGAWATFALALLGKEHALVAPALAFAMDRLVPPEGGRRGARLYPGYLAVALAWGGAMAWALRGTAWSTTSAVYADADLATRWRTAVSIVPEHVRLLAWPARLSADYEPAVLLPATALDARVALGAALLALALAALVVAARRAPDLALAIAWVPVTIAPTSNLLVVTGVALAERTLYLPSVGVALLAGGLAARVPPRWGRAAVLAGAALAVLGAARTWTRTATWHDARTQALTLAREHPASYRAHWVLARVARAAGDVPGATRGFAAAYARYPRDVGMLREYAGWAAAHGDGALAQRLAREAEALEARRGARGGRP